ncbi:MAG: metallophosphoesterase family protein [Lentimicrobiaceae bacterium]|nr:metallophosphoesterase family protein [Lentimicrobiaceae bacterium]
MKKIGLLSDTHGWLNPSIYDFFKDCDEIWHAGDIGSDDVAIELSAFKKLRAVYGNIDGWEIRADYPQFQIFKVEDVKVVMTHIGGYPNAYAPGIRQMLLEERPDIFISGHSHILKVMRDPKLNLLHLNPGAAGMKGFHKKVTMLRFQIDGKEATNLEIYEADRY